MVEMEFLFCVSNPYFYNRFVYFHDPLHLAPARFLRVVIHAISPYPFEGYRIKSAKLTCPPFRFEWEPEKGTGPRVPSHRFGLIGWRRSWKWQSLMPAHMIIKTISLSVKRKGGKLMVSRKLVRMIEEHAEQITQGLLKDIQTNPKTSSYHQFSVEEMHTRAYTVYKNLGEWLIDTTGAKAQQRYLDLGRRRFKEKIPVSQVVFALVLTKNHLLKYLKTFGLVDTALELHRELELFSLVTEFFDKAIYYTVRGYEEMSGGKQSSEGERGQD